MERNTHTKNSSCPWEAAKVGCRVRGRATLNPATSPVKRSNGAARSDAISLPGKHIFHSFVRLTLTLLRRTEKQTILRTVLTFRGIG